MAIVRNPERQRLMVGSQHVYGYCPRVEMHATNAVDGDVVDIILAPGALVSAAALIVTEAFDAGATVSVGTEANPTAYLAATPVDAVSLAHDGIPFTTLPPKSSAPTTMRLTFNSPTEPTQGWATVNHEYIIDFRADETLDGPGRG